jgi:GMP synthase-like glutamine amidotransferase
MYMSVLVLKNKSSEGPGTLEDYLLLKGLPFKIVDLHGADRMPETEGFDTLVMLGGPMSVNDDILYIRDEERLATGFMAAGKKVFGICLGAQIMAKALGSKVYKGPATETGWHDITLCDKGLSDPLMLELSTDPLSEDSEKSFKVFHWHGETFDIPRGADRLAFSGLYPNQAFKYGPNAYAFQFHIEVSEQMIYDWMSGEDICMSELKAETGRLYDIYKKRAFAFYGRFFG